MGSRLGLVRAWALSVPLFLGFLSSVAMAAGPTPLEESAKPPAPGTLIFLENVNHWVERWTDANIGHVAVVMDEGPAATLYEATPGHVRKLSWDAYLLELGKLNRDRAAAEKKPIRVWELSPATPYEATDLSRMKRYLETQVSRRYSVAGYLTGRQSDGVHCAELASQAISFGGRFDIADCHTRSPADVMTLAETGHNERREIAVPVPAEEESWCDASWRAWGHRLRMTRWGFGEATRLVSP